MSIETRVAKLAAGNVYVNIETSGSAVFSDLQDMSSIKYDFDLTKPDNTVSTVQARIGSVQVTMFDELSNGGSLYESMESAIGTPVSGVGFNNVNVSFYFEALGTSGYKRFPFVAKFPDMKFDDKRAITSFQLNPPILDTNMKQYWAGGLPLAQPSNVSYQRAWFDGITGRSVTYNSIGIGDFALHVIKQFNPTAGANILLPDSPQFFTNQTVLAASGTSTNNITAVLDYRVGDLASNTYLTGTVNNTRVINVLGSLAGLDGCIFGSAFDVNFFVARTNVSNLQTLTNNDVTDVKISYGSSSYNAITVSVQNFVPFWAEVGGNGRNPDGTTTVGASTPMWPDIRQTTEFNRLYDFGAQNIFFQTGTLHIQTGNYVPGSASYFSNINIAKTTPDPEDEFADASLAAMRRALKTQSFISQQKIIQTEILGVDKLKPHQPFEFDASVGSKFSGKYRPSSLEYDFKSDKIRVSAYQIA